MRCLFFFSSLLLLSSCLQAQQKEEDFKETLRVIDQWLSGQRDFDRLPGLSVAIVQDQRILFSKGYGYADMENKVPMKPETMGSICSISKLFTAVAIMQLWEQGKLRLDDTVSALLPTFTLQQQYNESLPITVRTLLTHSAGLPREANFAYWSAPDFYFPTEKEINEKLPAQQTLYPASTYFQYSNLGLTLLGQIVTRVSGIPFEQYIAQHILQPLRLQATLPYFPEQKWGKEMAVGYSATYRDGNRKKIPSFQARGITAAAGYSSSVLDLANFASWQFRLLNGNQKEILRPSTLKEMHRIQWVDPGGRPTWGLGFSINQASGTVGHGGSCPGYRSSLQLLPKSKLAAAIIVNAQGVDLEKYTTGIFNLLQKGIKDNKDTSKIDLEPYCGNYDSYTWSGEAVVVPWQGKLGLFYLPANDPASSMQLYQYAGEDRFRRIRDDGSKGEELRFERDASGKVVRFWLHDNFSQKIKP